MFKVECMCGAELEVSEASSSSAMRVNPHECKGWEAWREKFEENMKLYVVPEAASNTGTSRDPD